LENCSNTGHAIQQFFANGGRSCWAVRVKAGHTIAQKVAALTMGMHALDQVDPFNLPCIPEISQLDVSAASELIVSAEKYCEERRAFLLVDAPHNLMKPNDLLAWLNETPTLHHRNAALYYPRVKVPDPIDPQQHHFVPASGTMAGVIARIDDTRGVWKSPAGAELKHVSGLEYLLTEQENELLNRNGVSCLREFPNRGVVCWGARTLAEDPEWKYVNIRRLALFLEDSIQRGLQWAVFEPNNQALWARVRTCVTNFLHTVWLAGAFQGNAPDKAYFVKCDETTMAQDDIDSGKLNLIVGFAPLKPSEFVILRIGTWRALQ
jgi:phage tail sheath protein FI